MPEVMLWWLRGLVAFAAVGFSVAMIDEWVESLRLNEVEKNRFARLMLVTVTWVAFIILQWI